MNDATMKRLLTLAEKTGDKVIVTDPMGEHPYVLMTLDQYEELMGQGAKGKGQEGRAEPSLEKPVPAVEPKKTLLATGKFRLPIQDADFASPASLIRSKAQVPKAAPPAWKSQFPRKSPEKVVANTVEESVLDPEGEEQFFLEPLE